MARSRRATAAFSLLELLMVLAVVGILLGVVLPSSEPSLSDRLRSAAAILRTDLAYARSLAVSHNSTYRIAFDLANNRYVLEHSNEDPAFSDLDTLPDSPFRNPDDPPTQHIVDLDELPQVGAGAQLVYVVAGDPATAVAGVEFDGLGQTTRPTKTTIWLAIGESGRRRYLSLTVHPLTGLTQLGAITTATPSGLGPLGEPP